MGRIRKTLAWTFSPGGNMKGLIRAEPSLDRAAREHAELIREQNRLLAELNWLLSGEAEEVSKRLDDRIAALEAELAEARKKRGR
jgi:hypothetical protein